MGEISDRVVDAAKACKTGELQETTSPTPSPS